MIELPQGITETELEPIVRILNEKLRGLTLEGIRAAMLQELNREFLRQVSQYELVQSLMNQLAAMLEKTCANRSDERVYLGGATNILNQPEFQDIEKAKAVLSLLEEEKTLHQLLTDAAGSGVAVSIGQENKISEIQSCSMITTDYGIGGTVLGTIGILGPTRMDYGRVIAIMELVTQNLSQALAKNNFR